MINLLRAIKNLRKISIYHNIFFKYFINKSILVGEIGKMGFLNFMYKEKDLNS